MHQKTYLPIAFILFTAFVIGALLSARFGRKWSFALRPAFANSPQIGLIGIFWIFIYSIQYYWTSIRSSKPMMFAVTIPFLLLAVVEATNIKLAISQISKKGQNLTSSIRAVRDPANPIWAKTYCKHENLCNEALALLYREKLNIFAGREDEEKVRKRKKRGAGKANRAKRQSRRDEGVRQES